MTTETILTDEQIEHGRHNTFSTSNPFCPCDSKTMRKAARWAEQAVLQSPEVQALREDAAIKSDRQQRGEPVAFSYEIATTFSADGMYAHWSPRLSYSMPSVPDGSIRNLKPLFVAPQPAEINIDYKALYEKMCERCDYLDAKLAEYSEQPDTPAQEPSAPDCPFPCGWEHLHKLAVQDAAYLARQPWPEDEEGISVPRATTMRCLDNLIQVCRAMLAAAPKFGGEE